MKKMKFSIEIKSPKERVWKTLWDDKTFRDWAGNIDEGMSMKGNLEEGKNVEFISPTGNGVTSKVQRLVLNEFVSFRHMTDTRDGREREKEWTGGTENYSLTEKGGITTLTVEFDVPQGQEETFNIRFPRALKRVKILAEKNG